MYSYEFKQKHLLCTCKLDFVGTLLFHLSNQYRMDMYILSLSQLFIKLRYVQGCSSTSSMLSVYSNVTSMWQDYYDSWNEQAARALWLNPYTCAHTHKHTKSVRCNWFNCLWAEGRSFHVKLVADWKTKGIYSERTRVQLFHKGTVLLYASNCGTGWLS